MRALFLQFTGQIGSLFSHISNTNTADDRTEYAKHYGDGRHSGMEGVSAEANPHPIGSAAYNAWSDGHYDAFSIRRGKSAQYSASLWR